MVCAHHDQVCLFAFCYRQNRLICFSSFDDNLGVQLPYCLGSDEFCCLFAGKGHSVCHKGLGNFKNGRVNSEFC